MERLNLETSLETLLARRSIERFEGESISTAWRRYKFSTTFPITYKLSSIAKHLSNELGVLPLPYLKIDLVKVDDVAADWEVTIVVLPDRLEIAYASTTYSLPFEYNTTMEDVTDFLDAHASVISYEELGEYNAAHYAKHLLPESNLVDYKRISLNINRANKLADQYIYDILFTDTEIFQNEVATPASVLTEGDYAIGREFGNIVSHDKQQGTIYYSSLQFPIVLFYSPVKVFELSGDYSFLKVDDFNTDYSLHLHAQLLREHGIEWG